MGLAVTRGDADANVYGVAGPTASENAPSPARLWAATLNQYAVPFFRLVTLRLVADGATVVDAVSHDRPLSLYWTEYPVIGVPPSPGAVHETVAEALADTALTWLGRPGATIGETVAVMSDHGPSSPLLMAATRNT
jgi:hypothetical protein